MQKTPRSIVSPPNGRHPPATSQKPPHPPAPSQKPPHPPAPSPSLGKGSNTPVIVCNRAGGAFARPTFGRGWGFGGWISPTNPTSKMEPRRINSRLLNAQNPPPWISKTHPCPSRERRSGHMPPRIGIVPRRINSRLINAQNPPPWIFKTHPCPSRERRSGHMPPRIGIAPRRINSRLLNAQNPPPWISKTHPHQIPLIPLPLPQAWGRGETRRLFYVTGEKCYKTSHPVQEIYPIHSGYPCYVFEMSCEDDQGYPRYAIPSSFTKIHDSFA